MKKLLTFASAIAFLAMTCPAKSQTFASNQTALETRSPAALRDMVSQTLSLNMGERVSVHQGWGYALPDDSLLFCGKAYRAGRTEGFVVKMDGVTRDLVATGVSTADMASVGCGEPGYRVIAGAPYSDPLSGLMLDPAPRPEGEATFVQFHMPLNWETDPDCVAGRRLAYAVAIERDFDLLRQMPQDLINDTTQSFGLCFNASGQEFMNARLSGIIGEARIVTDQIETRALIQQAQSAAARLRRGY